MNSLLARQIKKAFGLKSIEGLDEWLSALANSEAQELNAKSLQEGLINLLKRIEDTYEFHKRDLTLRERSLQISSRELLAANEKIRNKLAVQQQVVNTLRSSVNLLLVDQNKPPIKDDLANISALSEMMLELINEQKTVERQVQQALDEAESANRAKSEFLATISHEIRTPMNAVIGLTHLALDAEDTDTKQMYLEKVKNNAASLLSLINNILDLSKVEAGKFEVANETFTLADTIEKLAYVFQTKASEKQIQLLFDIQIDPAMNYQGDCEKIYQVLLNLLSNALKFTASGTIVLTLSQQLDKVFFCVSDTGMGISEGNKAKLFDAFVQADNSISRKFGGTGLGLTICKSLVEHMGGQLKVDSEEGKGSDFYFSLPICCKQELKQTGSSSTGIAKKILCIKSSETVSKGCVVLQRTLERLNIECEIVDRNIELFPEDAEASVIFLPDDDEVWQRFINQLRLGDFEHLNLRCVVSPRSKMSVTQKLKNANIANISVIELPFTDSDLITALSPTKINKDIQLHDGLESIEWRKKRLSGKHVLVVDDDAISVEISQQILRNVGMVVSTASSGTESLALCDEQHFDAILLDYHLSDMSGREVAHALSQKDRWATPIIALSADESSTAEKKALAAGMCQFLLKPAVADDIIHAIDKHIHSGYTEIKQPPSNSPFLVALRQFYDTYKHASIVSKLLSISAINESTLLKDHELIRHLLEDSQSIGALSLHQCLLEITDKSFSSKDELIDAIAKLSQCLDITLRLIAHTLESTNMTEQSIEADKQPLIESITTLKSLLETFDAQAINLIEEVRRDNSKNEYVDYIDRIGQFCAVYDFERAYEQADKLLEALSNEQ